MGKPESMKNRNVKVGRKQETEALRKTTGESSKKGCTVRSVAR